MTDDLVVRLLAAIQEREDAAKAASALQWDPENGWGRQGRALTPHIGVIHEDQSFGHILANDPPAVLRMCQAHREIVLAYEGAELQQRKRPDDEVNNGYVLGISRAVAELAEGYGIEAQP